MTARLGALDPDVLWIAASSTSGVSAMLLALAGLLLVLKRWATVAAILVIVGLSTSGHAMAKSPVSAALLLVHLACAAWWSGALILLAVAHRRLSRGSFIALVRRFSAQALGIVLLLVGAGALLAGRLLEFRLQPGQPYTAALIVKVALAGLALAAAGFNRFQLSPNLEVRPRAAADLSHSVRFELFMITATLAATAALTTLTSPPH